MKDRGFVSLRWIFGLSAGLLLAGGGWYYSHRTGEPDFQFQTVTVTRSDVHARFVRLAPHRHFTAAVRDKFHLHDG